MITSDLEDFATMHSRMASRTLDDIGELSKRRVTSSVVNLKLSVAISHSSAAGESAIWFMVKSVSCIGEKER